MGGRSVAAMLKLVRSIVAVLILRFRSRLFWNWKTSPSVTSCTFFAANDRPGKSDRGLRGSGFACGWGRGHQVPLVSRANGALTARTKFV
jgi:hypothetical protein